MPAWVTVYCADLVADVEPGTLLKGIEPSDYWTQAEYYQVKEDLVAPAVASLWITQSGDNFALHYRPAGERQLAIYRWSDPERVAEEAREVLESLDEDLSAMATQIREHLRAIKAVVAVELGFSQLGDMGIVFAYEIARWFAQTRNGLVRGDDDNWLRTVDGVFVTL